MILVFVAGCQPQRRSPNPVSQAKGNGGVGPQTTVPEPKPLPDGSVPPPTVTNDRDLSVGLDNVIVQPDMTHRVLILTWTLKNVATERSVTLAYDDKANKGKAVGKIAGDFAGDFTCADVKADVSKGLLACTHIILNTININGTELQGRIDLKADLPVSLTVPKQDGVWGAAMVALITLTDGKTHAVSKFQNLLMAKGLSNDTSRTVSKIVSTSIVCISSVRATSNSTTIGTTSDCKATDSNVRTTLTSTTIIDGVVSDKDGKVFDLKKSKSLAPDAKFIATESGFSIYLSASTEKELDSTVQMDVKISPDDIGNLSLDLNKIGASKLVTDKNQKGQIPNVKVPVVVPSGKAPEASAPAAPAAPEVPGPVVTTATDPDFDDEEQGITPTAKVEAPAPAAAPAKAASAPATAAAPAPAPKTTVAPAPKPAAPAQAPAPRAPVGG